MSTILLAIIPELTISPKDFRVNVLRKCRSFSTTVPPRILITGGLGQLGLGLAHYLRAIYGPTSVILSDIIKPTEEVARSGKYIFADVLDFKVGML